MNIHPVCSPTLFRLAKEHNTDYSKVAITNQIAGVIASFIPALVLVDAEQGSGGEIDYRVTHNVVPKVCMTSKQRLRFSICSLY